MPSPNILAEPPRRLRPCHRVLPDRDGNISYLLTICVDGPYSVLNNQITFERCVAFFLDSPRCYRWFGRRFVIMPNHIHLIAHQGRDAVPLEQWIKAMKAGVGGLESHEITGDATRASTLKSAWCWQDGYQDHKFRTPQSEIRKWEYVCLNPVRAQLVARPEEWPFGGEIFYDEGGGPRLIRGTPPLLEMGMLVKKAAPREDMQSATVPRP